MQPSPYTPGEVARELTGRTTQLVEISERLSYLANLRRLVGRVRVDHAPRGWGKTSLLSEVRRQAESAGLTALLVVGGETRGLIGSIAAVIERETREWSAASRLRSLLARLTVKVVVGVPAVAQIEGAVQTAPTPAGDVSTSVGIPEFVDLIREAVSVLQAHGSAGLVLLIDEIQEADRDGLRTLAYAWQQLQVEFPDTVAAVFAAGLPNSPEVIGRAATSSERFAYRALGLLDRDAAAIALVRPARTSGVEWEPAALDAAVIAAQGFPYSVQLLGHETWVAAGYPGPGATLTIAYLTAAQRSVRRDLEAMFQARLNKATAGEQVLIRVVAQLAGDGSVARAQVATALGVNSRELSVVRQSLIDKGVIHAPEHGMLAFTAPGFAEFVLAARPVTET